MDHGLLQNYMYYDDNKGTIRSSRLEKKKQMPKTLRMIMGGVAAVSATCCVQPLDLVKTRMQMSGVGHAGREHKTAFHALVQVVQKEGVFAIYNGLSAGLARQCTYGMFRLGIFTSLMDTFKKPDGSKPGTSTMVAIAITAGAVGSFLGTPAEVALTRMTSDGRLPVNERRGYRHVFDALSRIFREEGIFALWKGCVPTVSRAIIVNIAQLVTYTKVKHMLLSTPYFSDTIYCHFVSSMVAGFVTTASSLPADIAKTRIQTWTPMQVIDGVPEYKGTIDVLQKVIRREGVAALWKGFTPCYLCIGPHTVISLMLLEQLQRIARGALDIPDPI